MVRCGVCVVPVVYHGSSVMHHLVLCPTMCARGPCGVCVVWVWRVDRYGLGQVYEMLRMPFYALHYYRKTTVLRPYDARMWRAMADCYTALERSDDAIKCLERAVCHVDRCVAHPGECVRGSMSMHPWEWAVHPLE